jgi:hypothetical protein
MAVVGTDNEIFLARIREEAYRSSVAGRTTLSLSSFSKFLPQNRVFRP